MNLADDLVWKQYTAFALAKANGTGRSKTHKRKNINIMGTSAVDSLYGLWSQDIKKSLTAHRSKQKCRLLGELGTGNADKRDRRW